MTYITGDTIKNLREKKKLTQKQLAGALSVSVPELLTGDVAANKNISANMKRSKFYVCPICGNVEKLYPEQAAELRFHRISCHLLTFFSVSNIINHMMQNI